MRLSNRQVKAGFWEDPDLLRLPRDARMLFHGLLHVADDSGCVKYDTFAFKMFLFRSPLDDDMTEEKISKLISELLRQGQLRKFEANGTPCLYILNFHKHQKIDNPRPPSCPLPPWIKWVPYKSNPSAGKYVVEDVTDVSDDEVSDSKGISGDLRDISDNLTLEHEPEPEHEPYIYVPSDDADGTNELQLDPPKQKSTKKASDEYTPEFEEFWSHYPRKIAKKAAFRVWKTRTKEGVSKTDLIRASMNYATECRRLGTVTNYIKHASTFLGPDRHFEDYIDGAPPLESMPHSGTAPNSVAPSWLDRELKHLKAALGEEGQS